jgi:hypothetical protein
MNYKDKVTLVSKQHNMKVNRRHRANGLNIIHFDTAYRKAVSFVLWPIYSWQQDPSSYWMRGCMDPDLV